MVKGFKTILNKKYIAFILSVIVAIGTYFSLKPSKPQFIILASTTSTEDSGLLKAILPQFTKKTGIEVKVVAVGTGQAFQIAARGDADYLLVHDRKGEDAFIKEGKGLERKDLMYNDFLLVGSRQDPFKIKGLTSIVEALQKLQSAPFISRGDESGTHRKELVLWKAANVKPQAGYREVGAGMGASLNVAAQSNAYILVDRATWASFQNKAQMEIMVEGDPLLLNPYGAILVKEKARNFHLWLTSAEGKNAIASFKVSGEQLFFVKSD